MGFLCGAIIGAYSLLLVAALVYLINPNDTTQDFLDFQWGYARLVAFLTAPLFVIWHIIQQAIK